MILHSLKNKYHLDKTNIFLIGKEGMLLKFVQNLAYGFNKRLFAIFYINQNIIQVYNKKDSNFSVSRYLVNIFLENCRGIK